MQTGELGFLFLQNYASVHETDPALTHVVMMPQSVLVRIGFWKLVRSGSV